MKNQIEEAFTALKKSVYAALETYSNVHRGSGYKSEVTSHIYDHARKIVIEHLGLDAGKYTVIFCSPARAGSLKKQLPAGSFTSVSSRDTGLSLGIEAVAVRKKDLRNNITFQPGGGTTRIISPEWVVWAGIPERYEAGTPPIINVAAFANALQLIENYSSDVFWDSGTPGNQSAHNILYHDSLESYSGKELLDILGNSIIGRDFPVPAADGPARYINLDNAASTPAFKPVYDTFCQALVLPPDIQYSICEEVRNICAEMLGAPRSTYEVVFTSNATESINLAARNFASGFNNDEENVIITTLLEHNSNDLPWRLIPGCSVIRLNIDDDGFVNLAELEKIMTEYNQDHAHGRKRVRLLTISGASNVLGIVNDLAGMSSIAHRFNVRILVDAAQLVAHRKVEIERTGIDYLVFSAHKGYAPFGCGVLIAKKGLLNTGIEPYTALRSSEQDNTAGIAAMGKALVLLQRAGMDIIMEDEKRLTVRLLEGLKQVPGLAIYGINDPASDSFSSRTGVVSFSHTKIFSNTIAEELAFRGGIGIRYGCHCAHILVKKLVKVGPFLEGFQKLMALFFPVKFPGLARVSLGIGNRNEDIETLVRILREIIAHPTSASKSDFKKKMSEHFSLAVQRIYTDCQAVHDQN